MDIEPQTEERIDFSLTLRQRRLRTMTAIVIVIIVIMLLVGTSHPFFRPGHPAVITEAVRRALKARALMIASYWTICLLLATSLFVFAWLDIREVHRKATIARRDYWKGVAERSAERRKSRAKRTNGESPKSS